MIRFASHDQVARRAASHPPEADYLAALEPAIVRRDARGVEIDTAHPAFAELIRRYGPPQRSPQPIDPDYDPSSERHGCCDPPRQG